MKRMNRLTSLACILALVFSLSACLTIEQGVPEVATDSNGNVVTRQDSNNVQINYYNLNNGTSELVSVGTGGTPDNTPPAPTQPPAPATQQPADAATQPPTQAPVAVSPASFTTDQEKLDFFNKALNAVKTQNPGFTKAKKTVGSDMKLSNSLVNAIAGVIKDSLLPNETTTTTVAKGESSKDVLSPSGKDFASSLTTADIGSLTMAQDGGNYVVTVTIPDATNPDPQSSAYAKLFDFITVDDIMNTYAPNMNATVDRENVFFDFAGCWAKATVSEAGVLVGYETFVSGTMRLTGGKIRAFTTDLNIVLSSTTTYTDFQW